MNQKVKKQIGPYLPTRKIFDSLCCESDNPESRGEPDTLLLVETEGKSPPAGRIHSADANHDSRVGRWQQWRPIFVSTVDHASSKRP